MTDIDGLIYDQDNKTLLIIQLKWMDDFGTSMKVRNSMAKNFYESSIKWITNVNKWIEANGKDALRIKSGFSLAENEFEDVKIELLILGRNFSHFSDRKEDKRAVWCSWYKLVRTVSENPSLKKSMNLLIEHLKIKSLQNATLPEIENVELQLGKYKFTIGL